MTSPPPVPEGSKAKITLTGTPATLLFTLRARLADLHTPAPILNDKWADYVAQQIDYDLDSITLPGPSQTILCARTARFDKWTRDFLATHKDEPVTILHLACGLDARAHRVEWGPSVRWIDLDLPDVVALRRKLIPEPKGDYTLLSGSALDNAVLSSIPADRPTAVIAEGLVFYLEVPQQEQLISQLCSHLPSGELLFDILSPGIVTMQKWRAGLSWWLSSGDWMARQGAGFVAGTADPEGLEKLYDGLKLREKVGWTGIMENPTMAHRFLQAVQWLPLPVLDGFCLRYTF